MRDLPLYLFGEQSVGKTSLLNRFVENRFIEYTDPTIGASVDQKEIYLNDKKIKLTIWDTSGAECFQKYVNDELVNKIGKTSLVVYDITRRESFEDAKDLVERLRAVHGNVSCPVTLVGNKADLEDKRQVTSWEAQAYAEENDIMFLETSAKDDTTGVNDIFRPILLGHIRRLTLELEMRESLRDFNVVKPNQNSLSHTQCTQSNIYLLESSKLQQMINVFFSCGLSDGCR